MKSDEVLLNECLQRALSRGLTYHDLARLVTVPVPTVIRWMEKKNYPHPLMIPNLIYTIDSFTK